MILIKENQRELMFNSVTLETKFKQLNFRPDDNGILRCYGRLAHAPLPQETTFPTLMNSKHSLTRLIVLNIHNSMKHISLKHTLTEVRNKYWICKGRSFVRGLLSKCVTCRKLHSKSYKYPANPPLPSLRLNDTRQGSTILVLFTYEISSMNPERRLRLGLLFIPVPRRERYF